MADNNQIIFQVTPPPTLVFQTTATGPKGDKGDTGDIQDFDPGDLTLTFLNKLI